jgi:hypothetical protein
MLSLNRRVAAGSRALGLLLVCGVLASCANWTQDIGVDNAWRAADTPAWVVGRSTSEDVMAFLGPPSQVINLDDQVIFYYLKERMAGQGYILLFYNRSSIETRYDRAIFFFDDDDVLTRYAYSNEALPYTE